MAPNKRDLESTDLNTKQGQPLTDTSNVSTPKIPPACDTQDDQSEANKSTSNLQSANNLDTTISVSKCYKGDIASQMEIISTSKNKGIMETENLSPILQPNIIRPKTPPMQIPVTEIFSPNTVKQVRSSIRALFPNGPPPPKPIVPVKRPKKGDTPYIVGCTKRRRVPEKKSLNVFKGDDYGITEETNSFDNEECCPSKRKCTKKHQYPNWSKSRFNPKSDEIAERLKKNEEIDMILNPKSTSNDTKNTTSYMSEPYKHRPQAFSPLPSTSKDNETIMKNEKQFSESLRYSNYNPCNDDDDDDELPEIKWESKNISEKKRRRSILETRDIDLISNEPTVSSEDLNNNNNGGPDEVELCEIQFDKYMPKKEFAIPESTTEITRNDPVVIDEIDLDTVTETKEPKRVLGEIQEVIETLEIKDDYSSITYEDLHSVPETTEPVDVDELFKDLENFQRRKKKISSDIITIVDTQSQKSPVNPIPKPASHNDNPAVNRIPTPIPEPSVNVAGATATEVIEIPDFVPDPGEPIVPYSREAFKSDVEFVSESKLDNVNNSTSSSSYHSADDENDMGARLAQFFFGNIIREYEIAHSHQGTNDNSRCFNFNDRNTNSFAIPRSRSKKTKKSKAPPQEPSIVNNENAAPSTNVQMSPTNGERRLGDCPICMDNLARGSIASTTCGHVFCLDCIKTCLRTNGKKCPTCRKTLKGIGYHLIFL